VTGIAAYSLLQIFAPEKRIEYTEAMFDAAALMQRAITVARNFCDSTGIEIDEDTDPNRTCLIGPELTPLMTTLGHLDAKRTTTDPSLASLIVHLLAEAGVSAGDTIAVGSSASFPAAMVATLAAAEAMLVHPVAIISLGASTYGATNPEFNLLDMYTLLLRESVFQTPPAAVSLGGNRDVGEGFDPALKTDLLSQIVASGYHFISEPDLATNVSKRVEVYGGSRGMERVRAFVNTGGSHSNLGTSPLALQLQPGLNADITIPPVEERGVLFEMAAHQVPIIHLLFIRGLASRYGLLWDPIPLSEPGQVELRSDQPENSKAPWFIGVPYLLIVSMLVAAQRKSAKQGPH
jgi:poly-gamma-glutamate system protein